VAEIDSRRFNGDDLTVEVMKLDENGRPQPDRTGGDAPGGRRGSAVGQDADSGFLDKIAEIQHEPDGQLSSTPEQ